MRKRLAIGATCGIVWGLVAAAVFLAMFRSDLPVPGEVGLPIAIVLILGVSPIRCCRGRRGSSRSGISAALPEIIGLTVASGAGLGLLVSAGIALARRLARNRRDGG